LEAQLNWKPSEVGSRQTVHGASRPSGYDRFMPGLTPEARLLQGYLEKNYSSLEKISAMLATLAGNIDVANPAPG
jgi:hypothetical protein